jgi:hypothetical protein
MDTKYTARLLEKVSKRILQREHTTVVKRKRGVDDTASIGHGGSRLECERLPIVAGVTERRFLVLRARTHMRGSCTAGAHCEAHRIQRELGVAVHNAMHFRPAFIPALAENTRCLPCLDKETRDRITHALWTGTLVDATALTHRYTARRGTFSRQISTQVGLVGYFNQQTPAFYSASTDPVTGGPCLLRE